MKFTVGFLLLLIAAGALGQQFPSDLWHEGKVVLEGGDTLRGQVKYNMQDDLLQLQANKKLETFTARKVVYFEIFDASVKRYRQFFSLPYAVTGQYKALVFFELLEEGKLTLIAREAIEVKVYSSMYSYGTYTRQVLVTKYYYLKEDGSIEPIAGKKADFMDLMSAKGTQVQKYVKENKLDFDRKYDVAQAVGYYNSLFR